MMNEQNDTQGQAAGACGQGCNCGTSGSQGRGRWLAGIAILLFAGALVVRAVVKEATAPSGTPATTGFATLSVPEPASGTAIEAASAATNAVKEIAALSDLNAVAGDMVGVFVFLPGTADASVLAPTEHVQAAVRILESQWKGKIGLFTLRKDSPDYEPLAAQTTAPGVVAMVKGGGMSAVSGDITESNLVQAFVAASSSGGCGPSGCGPDGCK